MYRPDLIYREIGAMLIGVGFLCAGLAVLKKFDKQPRAHQRGHHHLYHGIGHLAHYLATLMNVVDLILVAILACVTLHFYFRKKKKALSSGKEKEKPIRRRCARKGRREPVRSSAWYFSLSLEEEELAAEIADMYLHGRAYYYSGKPLPEQPKEEPISIKYKDVQWERLKTIHV